MNNDQGRFETRQGRNEKQESAEKSEYEAPVEENSENVTYGLEKDFAYDPNKDAHQIKQKDLGRIITATIAILIVAIVAYLAVDNMALRHANMKLATQLERMTSTADVEVEYGDLDYGSVGKPRSPLYPDMVVEWREDPMYMPQEPMVYLTFDDGPSHLTPQILDILDAYGVKATFFVLGKNDPTLSSYYKEILDRGHTLGLHSWTHQYNTIYSSVDNFLTDYVQLYHLIYEKTGQKSILYRFPGGSTNGYANGKFGTFGGIKEEMDSRGFIYYDWNVTSGDATGKDYSPEQLIANVVNGAGSKQYAVVLLHDSASKWSTVAALPGMIEQLAAAGFHFGQLTPEMVPVQFK